MSALRIGAVLAALVLLACQDEGADPYFARATSDAGHYTVEVEGEAPTEGANDLVIRVYQDGASVHDSAIVTRAVMPSMGHAASEERLEPNADGAYDAHVVFSMPGAWELQIEVDRDPPDSAVLPLEIE